MSSINQKVNVIFNNTGPIYSMLIKLLLMFKENQQQANNRYRWVMWVLKGSLKDLHFRLVLRQP